MESTHTTTSTTEEQASSVSGLLHKTIYEDPQRIAVNLPFPKSIQYHQPNGTFPLVYDPIKEGKAIILGMFVLRPGQNRAFNEPLLLTGDSKGEGEGVPNPVVYANDLDWSYNVRGLDGGWLIANSSALDAYRLGFQYGICDAVIVGTYTVATEGVPSKDGSMPGYVWAPYVPLSWPHVNAIDPDIQEKTQETRRLWQSMGYLSSHAPGNEKMRRRNPANIVFSWSGKGSHGDSSSGNCPPDFLAATIFQQRYHPDGEEIEVHIITSILGAKRIRERCHAFNLQDRIDSILHVLPPSPHDPMNEEDVDLTVLPRYLYEKLDIRIAQHDGGQIVLNKFFAAGIIPQFNVTLGRKTTVKDVIATHPRIANDEDRKLYLEEFDERVAYFFHHPEKDPITGRIRGRGIPSEEMKVISIIEDSRQDDVAIYVFDCQPKVVLSVH